MSMCCAELQKKLERDLYFKSEATFLSEDDLAELDLPYAQFIQKKASANSSFGRSPCSITAVVSPV